MRKAGSGAIEVCFLRDVDGHFPAHSRAIILPGYTSFNFSSILQKHHTYLQHECNFTEEKLRTGLVNGDQGALQALITTYFPVLCRFAEKFLPDSSLAKDMVQEAFIRLWENRKGFESMPAIKGFLFVTTRNGCLNLNRSRERMENRHQSVAGMTPDYDDAFLPQIVRAETMALIYEVVNTLSPEMQQIFFLSYEEGMTVKEISLHLGINLHTVKNYKKKALLQLRNKFSSHRELFTSLAMLLLIR